MAQVIKNKRDLKEDEEKEREINKSLLDSDGGISLFKEYYSKRFLPKVSKLTKEVHQESLPRVRKLLSEKLKEMSVFSKNGKLDLYDSETINPSNRMAHALI